MDELARLDEQMALLAQGDRSAIEPLFRVLWPLVQRFCHRALGESADADDAAQQTTEKIFVEAVRYDPTLPVVPWVLALAAWECRTIARRRTRAQTVPLDAAGDARVQDASPEDAAIERDLSNAARAALELLSPADREVLRATFEPTDHGSAAAGPTLRKRRERAIARLRETWSKLYGGG